jgi:L-fuculose-phosphate aldolase
MTDRFAGERRAIVETARRMNALGINQGKSGNLSLRIDEGRFLVTPSAVPYESLSADDLPIVHIEGDRWSGPRPPSTEWRIHRDILLTRPEVSAVLHAHPVFATAIACLRREIPAFHYMVAVAGGTTIRCAPYATFGTEELSRHALRALEGRRACLMANHGIVALGDTLDLALALAVEVETLAAMYHRALAIGDPVLLTDAEMADVIERFASYGR